MTNKQKKLIESYIRLKVKSMLKEEKENYIGINERKPLKKALDVAEKICREYTKGQTRKKVMEAFNLLYTIAEGHQNEEI